MRTSIVVATFALAGAFVAAAGCGSSSSGKDTGISDSGAPSGSSSGSSSGASSGVGASSSGSSSSGSSSGASSSGGEEGGASTFPFPSVIASGGPVLTAPDVITVTFSGDSLASQLAPYGAGATANSYWDTIRSGYCIGSSCVGDGTGSAVALTTAAAASYTDSAQGGASTIQPFISGLITAHTLPAPTANTLYVLYFPATTTITLDGAPSCAAGGFDGYHNQLTVGSQQVAYAIVPECAAPSQPHPITTLQNTTITASHEIIEAATDGISTNTTGGFYLDMSKPSSWGWNDIQGGEVADLCVDPFGLSQDETTEGGYTVQRIWSLANATAGKNPCVPIPAGEVYFNTYSQDSVLVMDVGASKTIEITAAADGTMAPWTVLPQDWTGATTYVSFSIAGGTNTDAGAQIQVSSGDKFQLTVTLLADPVTASTGEADVSIISANGDANTATAAHFWPFVVLSTEEGVDAGITTQRHAGRKVSHRPRGFARAYLDGR